MVLPLISFHRRLGGGDDLKFEDSMLSSCQADIILEMVYPRNACPEVSRASIEDIFKRRAMNPQPLGVQGL